MVNLVRQNGWALHWGYNIACHANLAISRGKRDVVGANQPTHINMAKDAPKPGSAPQTPPATPPAGM